MGKRGHNGTQIIHLRNILRFSPFYANVPEFRWSIQDDSCLHLVFSFHKLYFTSQFFYRPHLSYAQLLIACDYHMHVFALYTQPAWFFFVCFAFLCTRTSSNKNVLIQSSLMFITDLNVYFYFPCAVLRCACSCCTLHRFCCCFLFAIPTHSRRSSFFGLVLCSLHSCSPIHVCF